jgi:hypothetical protein
MNDYQEAIDKLTEEAEFVGNGAAKIGLLEEAVRLADTHGDTEAGFNVRLTLMDASTFAGRPDLLLVAFSWCLAQHDRDPDLFGDEDLLWKYKWVVNQLSGFPQISRQQIEAMLADMEIRFEEAGSTLHAVYQQKRDVLMDMGDREAAAQANDELARIERDWLSDCKACIADIEVEHRVLDGADEEALEKAAPILRGRLSCAEVPQRTYAKVLLPLLRLGRPDEAMSFHLKGYRLIAGNPGNFITHIALHMEFLALTGNLAKAVKLIEKHLPSALENPSLGKRFDFFLACRLVLDMLLAEDKKALKLRLPSTFPLYESKGRYLISNLIAWFANQTQDLAKRFDRRNGNPFFSQKIADLEELKKLATPCPLPSRDKSEK